MKKGNFIIIGFYQNLNFSLVLILLVSLLSFSSYAQEPKAFPEEALGWKLGAQSYTFKEFTFFEAVEKIKFAGAKYVEAFPGQDLGGGLEGKMDIHMEPAKRENILKLLKEAGVELVAIGVVQPDNELDWHQLFEFAKAMGIKNINSEPKVEFYELVSQLVDKYNIKVSIHNHPHPTPYWNPETVLEVVKKYPNLGACADIGHWVRSGLDPVESLRKLEGHVFHLHIKDLNELNKKEAHDVIWGNGKSNIQGVINELKRQNFNGMLSAEYEYDWTDNAEEVKESIENFRNFLK